MGDRGSGRPTWAEIDLSALSQNLKQLSASIGDRRTIAVVKADAYGHGAAPCARTLLRAGADALAVATVAEAAELRIAGLDCPVLLLEGLHAEDEGDYAHGEQFSVALGDPAQIPILEAAAERAGRPVSIHLHLDTGMTRLGIDVEELDSVLDRLLASGDFSIEGLMSHLACADEAGSAQTESQRRVFAGVLSRVRERGIEPAWIHLDNSPAAIHGATEQTSAVRLGLALYGADPTLERAARLAPVMSLCSRLMHVRDVAAGTRVGYGGSYTAQHATRIGILPLGYADGLPRAAAGRFQVSVEGQLAPLAGRVSMDLAAVDLGPDAAQVAGAEVLIFGRRHGQSRPIEELAEACGTIAYEILTGIGPRVGRVTVRRSA